MRIIGIDPGLARVGYGIIDEIEGKKIMLDCGIIETQSTQKEEIRLLEISKDLKFPILVRPSYVLGGQGMKIVINQDELEHHIVDLLKDIPGNRVLLDHYLDKAIEADEVTKSY